MLYHLKKSVFASNWVWVGRTSQCEDPGQYFSGVAGGREPFVVVRDESGTLRAFFDVCRHHAAKVTPKEGEGCAKKYARQSRTPYRKLYKHVS